MRAFGRGLFLLALCTSLPLGAATKTWTGLTGNPAWSLASNWNPMVAPVTGDDVVFPVSATTFNSLDDYGVSLNSIAFQGSGYTLSASFFPTGFIFLNAGGTVTMSATSGTVMVVVPVFANAGDLNFSVAGGGTLSVASMGANGNSTKNGAGTLVITGASMLAGTMTISAGTLNIQDSQALGAAGGGGTTVASGATLQLQGGITVPETLTLSGTGVGGAGALESVSGNNTWSGNVAMGAAATFGSDAGTLTIQSVVSGPAAVTKVGAGTLVLSGSNTYTGVTIVNGGVLTATNSSSLGTNAAASVANGAALQLDGTAASFTLAKALNLTGTGASGQGALDSLQGTNAISGNTTLQTGAVAIGVDAGTLTLQTLVNGGGGLTKVGAGTLQLDGNSADTYAGATTVNGGTLNLNHTAAGGNAIPGALVIGDGTGGAGSKQVALLASNQVADAGAITINPDGLLQLNGNAETIGPLTMTGGDVKMAAAGVLTLSGSVSKPSGSATAALGSFPGNGTVVLPATRTFDTLGTGFPDLQIHAVIQGAGGIVKTGTGRLQLSNNNTYTGATTINAGALSLQNPNTLGDTGTGTTINSGATLELNFTPFALAAEPLTLNGGTVKVYTTTLSGPITLAADSSVQILGGTATVNSVISGAGGVTFSAPSGGTFLLTGNNTYGGSTLVSSGVVEAQSANALGDAGGVTTVASGAALNVNGSFTVPETLTLNGTGIGGAGALRSTSGTNTISGNLALAADSTIGVAGQLTLGGVVSGAAGAGLTKVGAGTLTLGGANTYTGTTTMNAGKLLVNGGQPSSTVALNAGTLGGSGATGAVTGNGGIVSPGQSPGILGTGSLTLGPTDTFSVELNGTTPGTQYDQLAVTGAVSLGNAALSVSVGYAPTTGDQFVIISNDAADTVTGTFTGLPEGAIFGVGGTMAFSITYAGGTNANDVVLTNVPCDLTVTAPASATVTQTLCN